MPTLEEQLSAIHAEEKRRMALPEVDLVASGYEWICPDEECNTLNHEIAIVAVVICDGCGKEYRVDDIHHAYG